MGVLNGRASRTVVIVSCLALGVAVGPGIAGAAVDNFKDVVVQNTAANPVPVTLQGSSQVAGTVEVSNLPATQQVAGTVNVGNLPATQAVSGSVDVANLPIEDGKVVVTSEQPVSSEPVPRSGWIGSDDLDAVGVAAPTGVVITDVVVFTPGWRGGSGPGCRGVDVEQGEWIRFPDRFDPGQFDLYFQTLISRTNPNETAELHLESGLRSTENAPVRFSSSDSASCNTRLSWTGYEG